MKITGAILELIYKFNGMCGESKTEMGTLAKKEYEQMRKRIEFLEKQVLRLRDDLNVPGWEEEE